MLPEVGSTIVPPGFRSPVALGGLDHRDRRAVLDRPARVHVLDLRDELRRQALAEPAEAHERRVTDRVEDRVLDVGAGLRERPSVIARRALAEEALELAREHVPGRHVLLLGRRRLGVGGLLEPLDELAHVVVAGRRPA